MKIETWQQPLPHGINLSCRGAGDRGRPVLLFLHGFPEAAFIWDEVLLHFARPEHGGYRCVAPNLRGYEQSSQPADVAAYRPKHLVQDIAALAQIEGAPLACLVAHDWGGAVAWNFANQLPQLTRKLAIVNSPHPGTFLRALQESPKQREASAYMNFLARPDAEQLLRADGYRRLLGFFTNWGPAPWLTEEVKAQYRAIWDASLTGGLNYYRASPLRPPREGDPAAAAVTLPREMLTVDLPTLVIWGMQDAALLPELVEGLEEYVPHLTLERVPEASHWIIHEQPQRVIASLEAFLRQ
ncbi:alpha/beta hydrolase [Ramlibacter ginsenosidimutans]|uniref:Alpha/beta hydrolase n=1 Tax=Ramlibacter ginsenosidimutans TaxID=502333 RepID=A0A934WKJ6_9BURK|nr:alpha/beta hydrolase [Ramlibacter ginsenosidimutans]MBK6004685.1 alpha/beta hydrolase [Ramlibacter ginsenosidimutans]